MKHLAIAACIALGTIQANAQDFSIKESGSVEMEKQKDSKAHSFTAGNTHYFITQYFDSPVWEYNMQSINVDGTNLQNAALKLDVGVFNSSFSISDVIGLGNDAYAIVEHYNSDGGERVLWARKMSADGTIEESGKDILTIEFEKMLRAGRLMTATSPDGSKLAAVGVLPFDKKAPAKIRVAVYGESLNEISSSEFELPGLAIKNARYEAVVANDGTLYISRYTYRPKDGIGFTIFQLDPKTAEVEQSYSIDAPEKKTIGSYMFTTNDKNEMIVAASLLASTSVSVGGAPNKEIIIWRNENKDGDVMEINTYDNEPQNFEITGMYLIGETLFVTGEEAKEEKNSPANTTPTTANSTFTYSHEEEYILGFNPSGQKIFELMIDQKMSATNTKHSLYSAAHVIDGELVYIFNDQFLKYRDDDDIASGGTIPVAVTIDPTGLMTPAIPFINDLKLTNGYTLLPDYSQVSGNTITLLSRDGKMLKAVQIAVD